METIDNLTVHQDLDSKSPLTLSSLNFRLLLAAIGADRFAYYGLRSVIVFYAINKFEISNETAFYQYSYLTLIVYSSQLLGGFLGDFLLGARNAMLTGLGLCVLGALAISFENSTLFYAGIIIVAIGSGFFKPNTFSMIAHYTAHNKVLLEKRFISMYALINIGAFLSSLVIASLGEIFGYFYSFLAVLALYAIGMVLVFLISDKTNTYSHVQQEVKRKPRPITKSFLIIVLISISSAVFWVLFDKYSWNITDAKVDFFSELGSDFILKYMWSIPVVFLLLITIPYYFLAKRLSLFTKLGISMLLIGISWGASALFFETGTMSFGLVALIVFMFMEAIADMFLTPTVLTLLAEHSSKKYYGIVFAVYSMILYFAARAEHYFESSTAKLLFNIGFIVLLIASIVLFFILPFIIKEKSDSSPTLEEEI